MTRTPRFCASFCLVYICRQDLLAKTICMIFCPNLCLVYVCREARPLVKMTVKCPCGRKSSHQVVQEGQRAAAVRCDAACVQAGRQQQLAGAFGVEDPAHHVSSFDRNRSASIPSDPAVSTGLRLWAVQQQLAGAFSVENPAHHISSFNRNRSASYPSVAAVSYRTVTQNNEVLNKQQVAYAVNQNLLALTLSTGCAATSVMCMPGAQTYSCSSSRKVSRLLCGVYLSVPCLIILEFILLCIWSWLCKVLLYDQRLPLRTMTMLPLLKSARVTASVHFSAMQSSHKQSAAGLQHTASQGIQVHSQPIFYCSAIFALVANSDIYLFLKRAKYTVSLHLNAVQSCIASNCCRTPTYSSSSKKPNTQPAHILMQCNRSLIAIAAGLQHTALP